MAIRIFKTKWFARFSRQQGISNKSLYAAIVRAESGVVDADLGGGLIKQRVARPGKGRSGGYRVLVAYRKADRCFYLYGFAKSERENIGASQLASLRLLGEHWLKADGQGLQRALAERELEEVADGEQETESS